MVSSTTPAAIVALFIRSLNPSLLSSINASFAEYPAFVNALYISAAAASADVANGEKSICVILSSASGTLTPRSDNVDMMLFASDFTLSSTVAKSSAFKAIPKSDTTLSPKAAMVSSTTSAAISAFSIKPPNPMLLSSSTASAAEYPASLNVS